MRIKNWATYQHYKHRSPPWIKLHRSLLDDPEWHALDGDASKVLSMCWLIASEGDGKLPPIHKLAFRLRRDEKYVSEQISKLSHWLDGDCKQYASAALAPCPHDATTEKSRVEREREREKKDYYFEDGVIRLKKADFEKWQDAFTNLDLKAELLSLSSWASTQPNWFHAVKGALGKRNRENRPRPDAPKTTEDILNPVDRRSAWGLP